MSSCDNVRSTELGNQCHQNAPSIMSDCHSKPDECVEDEVEEEVGEEEDEDEDVDFNPFLKETPSPEASSSLSSDIEGVDGDVVDSRASARVTADVNSLKNNTRERNCDVGDSEHGEEEIVMQSTALPELQNTVNRKHNKRKLGCISQAEREKESQLISVKDSTVGNTGNFAHSQKLVIHLGDAEDDAICRRTRARYSLASFTLDELEAFLQETDDEDDVQNVDDEEEYRKFLAAVLQGGDGDHQSTQENENVDDEDEENDADFEIELEEALESDDDATLEKTQAEEYQRAGRRPETRQNRRQKASAQYERKLLEQTKRPLRPLLPIFPNGQIAPMPTLSGKTWSPEIYPSCLPSGAVDGFINGFTPYQLGQLHCLIHEHVQLLIQIFSLSVLDPSRQDIASQIQGLIFEMLQKRDEALACNSKPYPDACFKPPYLSSSVPNEVSLSCPTQSTSKTPLVDANEVCFSPNSQMLDAQTVSSPRGRTDNGQMCASWVPFSSGPVLSILDVAPLHLVGRYMQEVYSAVQESRQRQLENSCGTQYEKEPLFPFPCFLSEVEANNETLKESASDTVPSSVCQPPPKKTLAATLVEKTKKQSVAVVPKEIAKLAQRFLPLFNPALFPHKPPPASVASRVLFTDAEDELLALGIMEYNSDWKAIQQRFLPCKSKHQIFVRQKNRCSSKAPENPIKAVRRMKTSPLTVEEIQGIQEGLKAFKLDWMSVWKFIVPHRDPSLLPRQWRIALGTQRSYKKDEAQKERRRLYESERRKRKAVDLRNWQHASDKEDYQAEYTGGENCSGDDEIDNAAESYVHEGFLADWRPGTAKHISTGFLYSNTRDKNLPNGTSKEDGGLVREQSNSYVLGVIRPLASPMQGSPHSLNHTQHPYTFFPCASNALQPRYPVPNMTLPTPKSQIMLLPNRTRKVNNPHVVKLAPDLPPVNLPPSVRVISESALKANQCGVYTKVSATRDYVADAGIRNVASPFPHSAKSLTKKRDKSNLMRENVTNSPLEESGVVKDKGITAEKSIHTDLQMHPLLFQALEDGQVPYYPMNAGTSASSSFSFFSGNQPQLNLSLFYNPQQANHAADSSTKSSKMKESVSASCGIDFHPLLQRTDDANSELVTTCSAASLSVGLDGKAAAPCNPSNTIQMKSVVHCHPFATRSRPSSPSEKANELDLEIHLSSSSIKENAVSSRDATPLSTNSSVSLLNSQNATERQDTLHSSGNKFVSSVSASNVPSKTIGRFMDDTGEQSHPEIVMEQEELSDSDEEVEEHVEFECEEMDDSEGEGSDCEQASEMQEKEAQGSMTRKSAVDEDWSDQQRNLSTCGKSQGSICHPESGSPPSLRLGLTSPKNDANSSWLSLDSSASGRTSRSKSKNGGSKLSKGPPTKAMASSCPKRPLKLAAAPSTRKVAVQECAIDMAKQLSLGTQSVPTLKKPRKRTSRANKTTNAGSSLGDAKSDAKDSG
ncbi:hypothetical protein CCACVL1_15405 [Corchorus capsularis]|uniref:Myb-like domain-containing protein n=1 Tax=Corchorus capsularis TaxID=210143 RepID=A0A1R3I2M0_COCAP|nr:hypothetical protein CCACVL1_15405 [Corchorus capsularis]